MHILLLLAPTMLQINAMQSLLVLPLSLPAISAHHGVCGCVWEGEHTCCVYVCICHLSGLTGKGATTMKLNRAVNLCESDIRCRELRLRTVLKIADDNDRVCGPAQCTLDEWKLCKLLRIWAASCRKRITHMQLSRSNTIYINKKQMFRDERFFRPTTLHAACAHSLLQ